MSMTQLLRIAFFCFATSFICMAAPVAAAPNGGGTTVAVDGSTVTITVHFDLCCIPEDASQRDVWIPLVRAEIKAAQDQWNRALANLPAKGCYELRVVFDARLLNKGDAWDEGYHRISMNYTEGRSGSNDPTATSPNTDDDTVYQQSITGNFYEPSMSVGTWAHELGHLMGLGDDYFEQHGLGHQAQDCLPGRDGTLMCHSSTGIIDQDLADRLADILNSDGFLPQCWKGTMEIAAGTAARSDTWNAAVKVFVSDKGVASGAGTATRASPVKFNIPLYGPPCTSVQAFTVKVAGDDDRQSFRLKFALSDPAPPGSCDHSGFALILVGSPTARTNTIPMVSASRAEAQLNIHDLPKRFGSIDVTLDCVSCDSHIRQLQPDGQRR
jgi:hypothetical protein